MMNKIGSLIMVKLLYDNCQMSKREQLLNNIADLQLSNEYHHYLEIFTYVLQKLTKYSRVYPLHSRFMSPIYEYFYNPTISILFKDSRIYEFYKLVDCIRKSNVEQDDLNRISDIVNTSNTYLSVLERNFNLCDMELRTYKDGIENRIYLLLSESADYPLENLLLILHNYLKYLESRISILELIKEKYC